ncbi:hypothetical protein [Parapedobacter indicus]|uniref:Outer membrane protein beta-barrel domain-containing protein n=1 Tax=Parapedobacter indicus TaxID=1477437 RepID=A0A1I3F6B8_9SPHI|nr:hypothetical protein [Parapedobacter indicus]PPL03581.1 hypothetical protein CLV26_102186 [Parapedobacter indicus]SFI06757.1 hypothetical protein SAMN05444682_102186 [Parapedobacter indicus]
MKDKHPIDKLFKDGLHAPDLPFDQKDWEMLANKMRPRKKRNMPLLIWMTSGVAAALVLAAILWPTDRHASMKDIQENASGPVQRNTPDSRDTSGAPNTVPPNAPTSIRGKGAETEKLALNTPTDGAAISEKPIDAAPLYPGSPATLPPPLFSPVQNHKPIVAYTVTHLSSNGNEIPAVARTIPATIVSDETTPRRANGERSNTSQRSWALSVIAAPDLSGTQPLSGKLSGNVGLIATYRFNHWLSISGGALYAKKLYRADFADYRPTISWGDRAAIPDLVEANCGVLDIPILANITLKQYDQSSFFVSGGISSYFMLRETYNYIYPPHEYGYLQKPYTLHNRNRHLLGVGNLSIGYRRQLNASLSLTVQPFVKVPLTGIGNGNIKLYSTGVAISADIDLTRRDR